MSLRGQPGPYSKKYSKRSQSQQDSWDDNTRRATGGGIHRRPPTRRLQDWHQTEDRYHTEELNI